MKNLETMGVQEMNAGEMKNADGGLQIRIFGFLIYDTECPKGERWWGC
ncbi:MAG TPA: hypothetical protein PLB87_00600 [Prolixibacteraceae bacterium]|nr:hypothetical protein [Prolixibacteraceae bacterium]